MSESHHQQAPRRPFWGRSRWRYALLGLAIGIAETGVAMAIGVQFVLGGRDWTLVVGAVYELSLAAFGYVLGMTIEARRAERAAAQVVEEQNRQLETTRARLAQQEKLASLGQLAGTLAHEVRNPLAIIRSLVQNLEESLGDGDDGAAKSSQLIREEIDRLSRVMDSLVAFSKPLQLRKSAVEAGAIVRRTQLLARRLLEDRSVSLRAGSGGAGRVLVEADSDLICQVLLGLLSNAAEASPGGGRVDLDWRVQGDVVEFSVSDRGPGVPREMRERIFTPFFTTREHGSGLGLAVARQIVEAHGGRIEVDDGPQHGARFSVCLQRVAPLSAA